jgi:AraC-like DNA-binding protein
MAIDSFECKIITGGFNHCDSSWNKTGDELDQCFKIYYPTSGKAIINLEDTQFQITPGNIYFISGYNIVSQQCTTSMDIYWLHFVPASLYLRHVLLKSGTVHTWNIKELPNTDNLGEHISKVFRHEDFTDSRISLLPYSAEEAKLQAYILNFIADILHRFPNKEGSSLGDLSKLNPSIEFMNNEFRNNPALNVIASKSSLAPNYFHRIFKKNFGLTPYNYMLRLRMEMAIRLLTTTSKSVKEVAFEIGYESEYYFYRQFKKHYKYSPGKLKKMRPF